MPRALCAASLPRGAVSADPAQLVPGLRLAPSVRHLAYLKNFYLNFSAPIPCLPSSSSSSDGFFFPEDNRLSPGKNFLPFSLPCFYPNPLFNLFYTGNSM